jgi:hypothetical protein
MAAIVLAVLNPPTSLPQRVFGSCEEDVACAQLPTGECNVGGQLRLRFCDNDATGEWLVVGT